MRWHRRHGCIVDVCFPIPKKRGKGGLSAQKLALLLVLMRCSSRVSLHEVPPETDEGRAGRMILEEYVLGSGERCQVLRLGGSARGGAPPLGVVLQLISSKPHRLNSSPSCSKVGSGKGKLSVLLFPETFKLASEIIRIANLACGAHQVAVCRLRQQGRPFWSNVPMCQACLGRALASWHTVYGRTAHQGSSARRQVPPFPLHRNC